jgi:hypothetical protein
MRLLRDTLFLLATAGLMTGACGRAARDPGRDTTIVASPTPPRTAVTPKPLSDTVRKGLDWLARHQLEGGGWGQGDESPHMGRHAQGTRDTANVADTSMALLAFLRAGHTARTGDYQDVVQRGIDYVLAEIGASDDESLHVSSVRGTRVQAKIGVYADTFAALMMLNEARGRMRDGVANAKVDGAIRRVLAKIERNQREDGRFDDQGWAPVLTQALAAKALNRSAQNGYAVPEVVLDRVEAVAQGQFDAASGGFAAEGSAGVALYGAAAAAPARDAATTRRAKVEEMKQHGKLKRRAPAPQAPNAPTAEEIATAEARAEASEKAAIAFEDEMVARLDDAGFIAGFGNNGGEEFLSHLLIGESLALRGGSEWLKWDAAITALVGGVQNEDGSWTGHHCITGRTFCTAAALLVLLADRTPAPESVQIAG